MNRDYACRSNQEVDDDDRVTVREVRPSEAASPFAMVVAREDVADA